MLRAHRRNLAKGKLLGFAMKEKVRSPERHLHEVLLKRHAPLSELQDLNFPPEIEDECDEPVGLLFAREKHEGATQADLDALPMGVAIDGVLDAD